MNKEDSPKKIFSKKNVIIDVFLLIAAVVAFFCIKQPAETFSGNYCKPTNVMNGTDNMKVSVSKDSNYTLWLHIETPMQISFNDLPDVYNPLFVSVDNNSCYRVGGNQTIPLNTWVWINSLNSNPAKVFRVHLNKGDHIISVTGSYMSIDRLELLADKCTPNGNGTNCLSDTSAVAR